MFNIPNDVLKKLRKDYPAGTKVELIAMDDMYSRLKPGDQGTVIGVDDIGSIYVNWDCGSSLGVLYGVDECKKI